jgi:hypothetical protein
MWETDSHQASIGGARRIAQTGLAHVEFAMIAVVLLFMLCGIIELARLMYVYNTLAEATRSAAKAAATVNFRDSTALDDVRQRAIFRQTAGGLAVGAPITDQNVRIDYLSLSRQASGALTMTPIDTAALPGCPARNRHNCLTNPYGSSCIRLVRVRICDKDAAACEAVGYKPLFKLTPITAHLPTSTTIVNAEALGYTAGDALCP